MSERFYRTMGFGKNESGDKYCAGNEDGGRRQQKTESNQTAAAPTDGGNVSAVNNANTANKPVETKVVQPKKTEPKPVVPKPVTKPKPPPTSSGPTIFQ